MKNCALCTEREIEKLVRETFYILGGTEIRQVRDYRPRRQEPSIVACVHVVGGWSGTLCLVWSESDSRKIAAAVTDLPLADISEAQVEDCLKELGNMIGGNLKPLLGSGALLSPPKLIYCQNFDPAMVGGIGIETISFVSPDWGMSIIISPSDFSLKELWDAHGFIKGTSKGDAMRILVIEDEPVSQKIMSNILSSYGSVEIAGDGLEGYKKFVDSLEHKQPYDLVCLDIMMPHVPGLEVLQKIRHEENRRGLQGLAGAKVIMTSALDDGKNVLGSFRAGCEAYIVKPVDRTQLLDTVLKLFGDRISKGDK